jgi:hypothetical protein
MSVLILSKLAGITSLPRATAIARSPGGVVYLATEALTPGAPVLYALDSGTWTPVGLPGGSGLTAGAAFADDGTNLYLLALGSPPCVYVLGDSWTLYAQAPAGTTGLAVIAGAVYVGAGTNVYVWQRYDWREFSTGVYSPCTRLLTDGGVLTVDAGLINTPNTRVHWSGADWFLRLDNMTLSVTQSLYRQATGQAEALVATWPVGTFGFYWFGGIYEGRLLFVGALPTSGQPTLMGEASQWTFTLSPACATFDGTLLSLAQPQASCLMGFWPQPDHGPVLALTLPQAPTLALSFSNAFGGVNYYPEGQGGDWAVGQACAAMAYYGAGVAPQLLPRSSQGLNGGLQGEFAEVLTATEADQEEEGPGLLWFTWEYSDGSGDHKPDLAVFTWSWQVAPPTGCALAFFAYEYSDGSGDHEPSLSLFSWNWQDGSGGHRPSLAWFNWAFQADWAHAAELASFTWEYSDGSGDHKPTLASFAWNWSDRTGTTRPDLASFAWEWTAYDPIIGFIPWLRSFTWDCSAAHPGPGANDILYLTMTLSAPFAQVRICTNEGLSAEAGGFAYLRCNGDADAVDNWASYEQVPFNADYVIQAPGTAIRIALFGTGDEPAILVQFGPTVS